MKTVFEREDGYTEYQYKDFNVSYFKGTYQITDWFRDNTFKSEDAVKNAIDNEIRIISQSRSK